MKLRHSRRQEIDRYAIRKILRELDAGNGVDLVQTYNPLWTVQGATLVAPGVVNGRILTIFHNGARWTWEHLLVSTR